MLNAPIHVLLVDDDADLRDLLREFFQQRGLAISVLHDANQLERRLDRERPSIIVLDLMMPGVDGLTALRRLRANGDTIPVIMLTARAENIDRVVGLELGADDYVAKPFMPQELLARIHAVLRRHLRAPGVMEQRATCRFGHFSLDFSTRTLFRDGEAVRLTAGEYALLDVFASNPHETLSRARVLDLLSAAHGSMSERSIDVPVWRLRRLIEEDPANPRRLRTVRGVGYVFVPDAADHETTA